MEHFLRPPKNFVNTSERVYASKLSLIWNKSKNSFLELELSIYSMEKSKYMMMQSFDTNIRENVHFSRENENEC